MSCSCRLGNYRAREASVLRRETRVSPPTCDTMTSPRQVPLLIWPSPMRVMCCSPGLLCTALVAWVMPYTRPSRRLLLPSRATKRGCSRPLMSGLRAATLHCRRKWQVTHVKTVEARRTRTGARGVTIDKPKGFMTSRDSGLTCCNAPV